MTLRGDGGLIHDHFESVMHRQANSPDQVTVVQIDTPNNELASGGVLQGNDGPDYDDYQFFMQAYVQDDFQDDFTQIFASSVPEVCSL